MAQFLFVGDSHGDTSFVSAVCKYAQALGITTVIQLGDFGIWDHTKSGENFLDTLNSNAEKRGVKWLFVAGNHENYDRLEEYQREAEAKEYPEYVNGGMVPIRDNILWVGRANHWKQDGVTFGAIGGAVSIDRYSRRQGDSWWPQESTNIEDLRVLYERVWLDGPVDVLLTHDAPDSLPVFPGFIKDDPMSNANRAIVTQAGLVAQPQYWFHGHYHRELKYEFDRFALGKEKTASGEGPTKVYGLDCNPQWSYSGANVAVWDSTTGDVEVAVINDNTRFNDN